LELSKPGANIHIVFVAFCFWLILILVSSVVKECQSAASILSSINGSLLPLLGVKSRTSQHTNTIFETPSYLLLPSDTLLRMAANNMAPREIKGTPGNHNLSNAVEDILNYNSDLPYEVIYIPLHPTKYVYRITCDDIQSVPKDRNYINSCLLQARVERVRPRDPSNPVGSAHIFRESQPFQIEALPREDEAENHEDAVQ
jgi:hypothetical protein